MSVEAIECQSTELRASVFKLGRDFNYSKLGEIIWNRGIIQVDPAEDRDLQQIAGRSYWLANRTGIKKLSPKEDAVAWISNLHKWYSGGLIRIGKVRPTQTTEAK
jgi:hypothetical protein